jgi:superfamily II DNA or RNA helicase/HKD family nuclease
MAKLHPGLYAALLTKSLQKLLEPRDFENVIDLEKTEAPAFLSNKLRQLIQRSLESIEGDDAVQQQVLLFNKVLSEVEKWDPQVDDDKLLDDKCKLLEAILRTGQNQKPAAPVTSLVHSSLFTGSRNGPQLFNELIAEMESADRLDILVSFILNSGFRLLRKGFDILQDRKVPVRIITTTYLGATQLEAIEGLAKYSNVQLKISFDKKHTRLHAKAYYFHRNSGFSTAYVGSSNMSDPAMKEGLEWNLKVTSQDLPDIIKKFEAEFEGYWNSPIFSNYRQGVDKKKLQEALDLSSMRVTSFSQGTFMDVVAYPFQNRILENLDAERMLRGSFKNLVIAATGTGKTVIAALDYRRFVGSNQGRRPKLLFLAHRDEILSQSLDTFRIVLKDANFASQLGGGRPDPANMDHLFCTVQTFHARELWTKLPADYYEYIVVDEVHHSAASSYQGIFDFFKPKILLGLTATPERMDGENILKYFNDRVAAELRLPEALEEKLLCPFQYFCVADPVNISDEKFWDKGKYSQSELEKAYVNNPSSAKQRTDAIFRALDLYCLGDIQSYKGLAFCVSVKHAEFMAQEFNNNGLPSLALHAQSLDEERKNAVQALRQGKINFIFTVDLFNEGVDIPEVDLVLFLRPTDSLTVYLQQLGRGLRHSTSTKKECLLVLDFVAQMHKRYRIDRKFAALLPSRRFNIEKEVLAGFPHLPPGCIIQMEKQAMVLVLQNIKAAYSNLKNYIPETLKAFEHETGLQLTFANYFKHHDLMPEKVLAMKPWCEWKAAANIIPKVTDADAEALKITLGRICQSSGIKHLQRLKDLVLSNTPAPSGAASCMLHSLVWGQSGSKMGMQTLEDSFLRLKANPNFCNDISEIASFSQERSLIKKDSAYEGLTLELHAHYGNDEIQAAFGIDTLNKNTQKGVGVLHFPLKKSYALLITTNKTENEFSASTMYKDYPINERLFHWESQSNTLQKHVDGKNMIHHKELGYQIFLFVRINKKIETLTVPFQFLGRANQVKFEGERPIAFVWELENDMPAELLEEKRVGG